LETAKTSKDRTPRNGFRYTFDEFEIDPGNRLVLRLSGEIGLTRKLFDLLLIFLENPGRLLEKDELIEKLWKEEFVEEGNLARQVSSLRKALGDTGKHHKYITTVAGHGYRFIGNVQTIDPAAIPTSPADTPGDDSNLTPLLESRTRSKPWVLIITAVLIILTFAWVGSERLRSSSHPIRSIAVLPLKRIDGGDNYLGIGIADAVIRKISQSHQLTVRPTSSILRFASTDADTLTAGRELNTDAVLEGNVQSSGGRLRISINLLRTSDGSSLWADNFDMPASDLFAVQDRVAQQVATRLQVRIDTAQISGPHTTYPANAASYEFYVKGIFSLDQRRDGFAALSQMQQTFDFFKRSIEADPEYAPAHAQLAWAYAWTATLTDPSNEKWVELARQEIKRADELEPQIAETHLAKSMLYWSKYENYQYDQTIRELQTARHLNATTNHGEFAGILAHLGLEERAAEELRLALEIDPSSQSLKDLTVILPFLRGDADGVYVASQKLTVGGAAVEPWYYLQKKDLIEARKTLDERLSKTPDDPELLMQQALYQALTGAFHDATSDISRIIAMVPAGRQNRHHQTYTAACIYALAGDSQESVRWLKDTAATGFPNYPLFARDPFLDRVRASPEFVQFMDKQRAQWERFQHEAED
jgi:DNA-binding winged helix-turn-helix (wHTH) protein/TolB-like protein